MPKLNIIGWRVGLQKISMNHILRERLQLGLKDAKGYVDDVLAGKLVSFALEDSATAETLAKALEDVGAIVEIEADQNSLRVATNGEA
ncbi:MAG: ribosomal protein L7/L12 [Acidobacteria bacterium]|nr:ribosomal protein L7/L12 [Acidobacteriota bacterium]